MTRRDYWNTMPGSGIDTRILRLTRWIDTGTRSNRTCAYLRWARMRGYALRSYCALGEAIDG